MNLRNSESMESRKKKKRDTTPQADGFDSSGGVGGKGGGESIPLSDACQSCKHQIGVRRKLAARQLSYCFIQQM